MSGFLSFAGREFWDGAITMTSAAQALHSLPDIISPYENNRLDITILVYCRNQESSIPATLQTVAEAMDVVGNSYEIIVIDDASADRSAERVREFMAEHDRINLVFRMNKQPKGLAQNYFDGAFMGCGQYYRLVHGDNAEPVEMLVDILRSTGDADIIVPYYISRLRQGVWRTLSARLFNGFLNLISGNRINCYTATPIHLRYNVMRWHSDILGHAFQMDLLCQLLARGFTYKQVPCRAVSGKHTETWRWKDGLSFLHAVLNIILRRVARGVYGG